MCSSGCCLERSSPEIKWRILSRSFRQRDARGEMSEWMHCVADTWNTSELVYSSCVVSNISSNDMLTVCVHGTTLQSGNADCELPLLAFCRWYGTRHADVAKEVIHCDQKISNWIVLKAFQLIQKHLTASRKPQLRWLPQASTWVTHV